MNAQYLSTAAQFLILFLVIGVFVFLVKRMQRNPTFKLAMGLAVLGGFFLLWVNLAVGIIGEPEDPANLMYFAVPAIGLLGAIIARFRTHGMARTLFLMTFLQAVVAAITAISGMGNPPTPTLSLLILNGILFSFWLGSALLFRKAGRADHRPDPTASSALGNS